MFIKRLFQISLVMVVLAASILTPNAASATGACGSIYIVQPGDWLIKIAERCGVTLQALYNANPGVAWQRYIYPGQALNIPGGTISNPTPPPPMPGSGGPINGCPNPFCEAFGNPQPGIQYFWYPSMVVTPQVGGSYFQAKAQVNKSLTFQARVRNNGDVPLQVMANLNTPAGWDLGVVLNDCPVVLHVGAVCTFSWGFTPRVTGSVLMRVYGRGFYIDPFGSQQRVTNSPGFVVNVY